MKKLLRALILITVSVFCIASAGCFTPAPEKSGLCRVVVSEGKGFICRSPVADVERGKDAEFTLIAEEGYEIEGTDYSDYTLSPLLDDDSTRLTVKNVRYSSVVEISVKRAQPRYTVSLMRDEAFSCEKYEQKAAAGQSVTFDLNFKEEYTFGGFSETVIYDETGADSVPENGLRKVTVTVKKIEESVNLRVIPVAAGIAASDDHNNAVRYDVNGGEIIGSTGETFSIGFKRRADRRPNTHTGTDKIRREGYVLIGWNTRADGSGEHIGLGSRFSAPDGKSTLFAEWSEYSPQSMFSGVLIDREDTGRLYAEGEDKKSLAELVAESDSDDKAAVITGYSGNLARVTVPAYLDGYPVAAIASGSFEMKYGLETVIFPDTLEYVADVAFTYCDNLREVYLFDNIINFSESAFGYSSAVSRLHINAVLPPAYANTENAQLANKLELLHLNSSKKPKMVFFAGCSVWYGINSTVISQAFGGRYEVFNMGVVGGTCALFQIDLILRSLKSGDVFVHNPETAADYQLLINYDFDSRVFITLESNYDYLAVLDLTRYTKVWSGFSKYLSGKRVYMSGEGFAPTDYDDGLDYMDMHGDHNLPREGGYDNGGEAYEVLSVFDVENGGALENMIECYTSVKAAGADVYLGFAPVNSDALNIRAGYELENYLESGLAGEVNVYMNFDDCVFGAEYFYDTNYHLSTEGKEVYTAKVAEKLKKAMQ